VLNTLAGNRPHQGFVLRCGTYEFDSLVRIPSTTSEDRPKTKVWLVLDEVVDPQNLGALIRTSYFLGGVNMLVCAKNSAPPSATVSAASAGALELAVVYSTTNLPKTLAMAEEDGFRIIGASADGAECSDIPIYDLQNLPPNNNNNNNSNDDNKPILLVLGSESRGLRHLVAKSCTEFVRIPAGGNSDEGVDSLNVSVTGGILLWQLLQQQSQ
jgi:21S rRNA (GM2251-2'-O)-methyltransferase